MQPVPLNLVWNRPTLDYVLEGHFIKEVLLGEIGRSVRMIVLEPGAKLPLLNDALVVSCNTEFAEQLGDIRARGCKNIGLFHMADEQGDQDRSFYRHADYVLRNYWFEHLLVKPHEQSLGVVWVPNGYRTGVGPISPRTLLRMADRTIMGFFAGALKGRTLIGEREQMMNMIRDAKLPFIATGTPGFGQGFGPVSYAAYLSSARFALVPGGNSPETIRLYEALEAGAIPIMLKSKPVFAPDALDSPPFILLDAWDELPRAYAPFQDANNPEVVATLDAKQHEVMDWWAKFKIRQQCKVKNLIDRSFARAHA